jgi:hypothetical protein
MQLVFIMKDGRACGRLNYAVDDPVAVPGDLRCDSRAVKAVRFSITARSSSAVPGFTLGTVPDLEDFQAAPAVTGDQYLRRTVTGEVQLRNNP